LPFSKDQSTHAKGADADAARVRALAAYSAVPDLWQDTDREIHACKAAKAEHAKLL
jgi:hypothetical protein